MPTVNTLVEIPQPKVEELYSRLSQYNSNYVSSLAQLEDKLHKLLDKRQPENKSNEDSAQPIDFYHGMSLQLDFLNSHNNYLNTLLEHLNEIV